MDSTVNSGDPAVSSMRGLLAGGNRGDRHVAVRAAVSAGLVLEEEVSPFDGAATEPSHFAFVLLLSDPDAAVVLSTLRRLRLRSPGIPVVVRTGRSEGPKLRAALFREGASEVVGEDAEPEELHARVYSVVDASRHRRRPATIAGYEDEVRSAIDEIVRREYETLYVLGKASEYRDQETGAHIARVAHYSRLIARMVGVSEADQEVMFHASALHDIGKLAVPDSVLLKPAPLDTSERTAMRTHCVAGHGMLKDSQSTYLLTGAMIALTHHEKFDGSGYPMGLRGREIPLYGRIVGIADVFDALTTRRPYKDSWQIESALEYIGSQRNRHFDPELADAFVYNAHRVREIFERHSDELPPGAALME